jgi:HlyD family secretion protein
MPKYKFIVFILILFTLASCSSSHDDEFSGYVDGELTFIATPYSGNLLHLYVQRGEMIGKNTLLFSLDPEPQIEEVKQAKNNLISEEATLKNFEKGQRNTILDAIQNQIDQAKANLELAKIRLTRAQELYDRQATSKDALDAAIANYQSQQALLQELEANLAEAKLGSRTDIIAAQVAKVEAAKAQLAISAWQLKQKTVYAPINAIVYDKYFREGEFVIAGNPVVSLLAAENIYIIFFIPESSLSTIKLNQTITVNCDNCQKTYQAKIIYISPEAEYTPPVIYSRTSNYKYTYLVRAQTALKDAYALHPGQPVYVRVNNEK